MPEAIRSYTVPPVFEFSNRLLEFQKFRDLARCLPNFSDFCRVRNPERASSLHTKVNRRYAVPKERNTIHCNRCVNVRIKGGRVFNREFSREGGK